MKKNQTTTVKDSAAFEEKGQRITDGLLENDEQIFTSASNVTQKGLQQFYTPEDTADQLADIFNIGKDYTVVVDLTAGDGRLLRPFLKKYKNATCFGIELDKQNIPRRMPERLKIVNADLTKFAPLLSEIDYHPSVYALNPPFNLWWKDKAENKVESQKYVLEFAMRTLQYGGAGYIITSKTFYDRYIEKRYSKNVIAVIYAKNLFAKACVDVAITVFQHGYDRNLPTEIYHYDYSKGPIPKDVIQTIQDRLGYVQYSDYTNGRAMSQFLDCFEEYKMQNGLASAYNIDLRDGKLDVFFTNFRWKHIRDNYDPSVFQNINKIQGKDPNYLAFNTYVKKDVIRLTVDKVLTVSPDAQKAIDQAEQDSILVSTPFKTLPPQQRLGYLQDIEWIKCTKSFTRDKIHFVENEMYSIQVKTSIHKITYKKEVERKVEGVYKTVVRNFSKDIKTLRILISLHNPLTGEDETLDLSEEPRDIQFLIDHFDIPDPQDIASVFPERHAQIAERLKAKEFVRYNLYPFQVYDIARAAMKDSLIIALEQGLGKTRLAQVWAKLKDCKKVLIICPQDLKKQWIEESFKFGIKLQVINSYADVKCAQRSTAGWFITHYEFLSIINTAHEQQMVWKITRYGRESKKETRSMAELRYEWKLLQLKNKAPFDKWLATQRESPTFDEHTFYSAIAAKNFLERNKDCRIEEVKEWTKRFEGYSKMLKNCFDTILLDEGVKIKTKTSLRGLAVRRLKARNKLLLSGSPIKNYFVDLYYLFGWLFGYGTIRFPYDYKDREKFLSDFGTFEKEDQPPKEKARPPKLLPEINNLSLFWKLTAPAIMRRKKEDTGEKLVAKHIHRISVDFSEKQNEQYKWWANVQNFMKWFTITHPKSKINKRDAKFKGQLWKLRFTSTAPTSRKVNSPDTFMNDKPYTNKILMTCQLVRNCLLKDEQVVIFTNLQDNATFLKHVFGSKAQIANGTTVPRKRAEIISAFKHKQFPILIAGIEAMNLGHSLEVANNCIVLDYPWEHSTFRQAIDRIHRLNSTKDVNVYMLYVEGSYDQVMLEIVDLKGHSSDLAIDGRLTNQDQTEINFRQILKKTIELYANLKQNQFVSEDLIQIECEKILKDINTGISRFKPIQMKHRVQSKTQEFQPTLFGSAAA